jgi:hypothetical protein
MVVCGEVHDARNKTNVDKVRKSNALIKPFVECMGWIAESDMSVS